jgi:predicted transcriptional regulator
MDRLRLLSEITIEKRRLSQLTAKLSATSQETSKHLMRLRDAELIEKDSNGFFSLSAFGKIIVNLLPSIRFLAQNREYFLSHDISSLPLEFIERLGELQEGEYAGGVGSILAHTQQVVQDAEKYIWLMADHILGGEEYVPGSGKLENSTVTWRVIVPAGSSIDWTRLRASVGTHKGRIEYHLMEDANNIKAGIALNEKIAGLTFPDSTGKKLDFNCGFRSSNPIFRIWCQDLYEFHWNSTGKNVHI